MNPKLYKIIDFGTLALVAALIALLWTGIIPVHLYTYILVTAILLIILRFTLRIYMFIKERKTR